jgi:hypothetical protein
MSLQVRIVLANPIALLELHRGIKIMAFIDFKNISEVQKQYQIKYQTQVFIPPVAVHPTTQFVQDLRFYQKHIDVFSSAASRSEVIISPLLREVYKSHHLNYSLWIQKRVDWDEILWGMPDYIFSAKSALGKTVLEPPISLILEVQENDFEQGWSQCLAELIAAQYINQDDTFPVYGIVTDGNLWQFGKLEQNRFTSNSENFTIDKISLLYGALDQVLQVAAKPLQLGQLQPTQSDYYSDYYHGSTNHEVTNHGATNHGATNHEATNVLSRIEK